MFRDHASVPAPVPGDTVTPPATREHALLRGVAGAAEVLTGTTDLDAALAAAARILGEAVDVDRVHVLRFDHATAAGHLEAEWVRPGVPAVGRVAPGPYALDDYAEVWRPLMAGRVYHSPLHAKSGTNAALNAAAGVRTDLFVPVLVDGAFWGALAFDDCTSERCWTAGEIEVLRAAAAAVAAAVRRARDERVHAEALAVERARAAAARAEEAERLNGVLEGVVAASRDLLDAPAFDVGLRRWLARVAGAVGADRAGLGILAADPAHPLPRPVQVTWQRPGLAPLDGLPIPPTADFDAWTVQLQAGAVVCAKRADLRDPASRAYWAATGCGSNIIVPVLVDGGVWAGLYLDFAAEDGYRPSDVAVLRTAADGLAAAVRRDEALRAATAEREARAADLARRSALLATAVAASHMLIDATEFDAVCDEVLALLGPALDVDRAAIGAVADADDGGAPWCTIAHEWTRPGVPRQIDDPTLRTTRLAVDALRLAAFRAGEPTQAIVATLPEPLRGEQEATGACAQFAMPILVDGRIWGVLGFDDCRRPRVWDAEEIGFLRVVTAAIAAAVHRARAEHDRADAVARERARAAEARAAEHGAAAAALERSVAALAGTPDVARFLPEVVGEMAALAGAATAALLTYERTTGMLACAAATIDGVRIDPAHDPRAAAFRGPVAADRHAGWTAVARGGTLLRPVRDDAGAGDGPPGADAALGTTAWHAARGHRWVWALPVALGDRPLGVVELGFRRDAAPSEAGLGALEALATQAALALELTRLAENGRRTAVLEERARLARDVHDTLAQGVAGLVLALRHARRRLTTDADALRTLPTELARLDQLAARVLQETRQGIAALRLHAADGAGLAVALRDLVTTAEATRTAAAFDAAVRPPVRLAFVSDGPAGTAGDPAAVDAAAARIPAHIALELFRIAQAAFTNALLHADATGITVALRITEAPPCGAAAPDAGDPAGGADCGVHAHIVVSDDGRGFDPQQPHPGRYGLVGMAERAARIGARLTLISAPGAGTEVVVMWRGT